MNFKNFQVFFLALTLLGVSACQSNEALEAYKSSDNGEYISLNGKITDVQANGFNMDVDGENILVEMDDFDSFKEGYQLKVKDQVMVFGMVDKDFLEKRSLEASTVYVKNLNTHFFASSADEEDFQSYTTYYISPNDNMNVLVRGRVLSIADDMITLSTGVDKIRVSTKSMFFNPIDTRNYMDIAKNDYIEVSGMITPSYLEKKDIEAFTIKEL